MTDQPKSVLFSRWRLRGVDFPNRVVISPMQMYLARDGLANDWHFQHLAKYAVARAGCVFTEVLCVEPRGRNTHWDLGIWNDGQVPPLARIREFVESCGAVAAAQIGHCGGKASRQRPFDGHGPLGDADATRGEPPWTPVGPIAEPSAPGYHMPYELTTAEIADIVDAFADGTRRVAQAGFRFLTRPSGYWSAARPIWCCSRARPSTTRTGCCTRPGSSRTTPSGISGRRRGDGGSPSGLAPASRSNRIIDPGRFRLARTLPSQPCAVCPRSGKGNRRGSIAFMDILVS